MNEIIKYANGMNASQHILDWIDKCVEDKYAQQEVEHIIDYLVSDKAPKNLERATYKQMKKKAEAWMKSLQKKGENIKEKPDDVEVIKKWRGGYKFVKLVGKNAYKREGFLMRHCVESYFGKNDEIYSLRDKDNIPHCTISKQSQQIKGKGNGKIHPKYIKYVVEFLEELGVDVRDSEMRNLGYVNVENFEDKNAVFTSLFRGKYFYLENDILDKNGEKYENITLWGIKNIFDFSNSLKVKINFDFKNCIETFKKFVKPTRKLEGNFNRVAMKNYNHVVMEDSNRVAMEDSNRVAMEDSNRVAMKDYNHVAMEDCNRVAMGNINKAVGGNENEITIGKKSVALMGAKSKIKGKIGSWMSFIEEDDNSNILNIHTAKIDGKKYKEDIFYWLKDGKIVEFTK